MNEALNSLLTKAKEKLNHAYGHAKETIFHMTGTSSASVQQIADFILQHPDTMVVTKNYLGIPVVFYELENREMNYYMEVSNSKILQLDVQSNQQSVIAYRSYRDHMSLNTPVKFPEIQENRYQQYLP